MTHGVQKPRRSTLHLQLAASRALQQQGEKIGGAMGANNRAQRAQKEQLASMGLNEDTMRLAQQTALELKDAESSLEIVRGAERSQSNLGTH